MENVGIPKN